MTSASQSDGRSATLEGWTRGRWPAALALGVGLALTAALGALVHDREQRQARERFEQRAADAVARVEQSFKTPLESLHATAALMRAQPDLDGPTFHRFAAPLLERHRSLAALEWAAVVERSEREAFERRMSALRGRPFEVREPSATGSMVRSPERDRHVVLVLLEPPLPELDGFDARFEPGRRSDLDAAIAGGEALATARFRLVEDAEGVFSIAVYEPVFAREAPATAEERTAEVEGVGIALYRLDPLVRTALSGADEGELDFALVDDAASLSEEDRLLFVSRPGAQKPAAGSLSVTHPIAFAGRDWLAVVSGSSSASRGPLWTTALAGTTISLGVALLVGMAAGARRLRARVRALASLGEYTLVRELGAGGMGTVFEATHGRLRRRAAIKLIHPAKINEETIARFDREAQTMSKLAHPNTVTLFDYGRTDDGRFYLVMEYLRGMTLELLIDKHGAQSAPRARHILIQICHALTEAHDRGLIHRDIKPANLMLCVHAGMHDFVKVLDFGLAKNTQSTGAELSGAGLVVGTTSYLAPECLLDPGKASAASDLYALGCVAFFLLTGRDVFGPTNDVVIMAGHLTMPPPPMECGVPAAFEEIVRRCLAKIPEERFASARQLARALAQLELDEWTEVEASAWWAAHGPQSELPDLPVASERVGNVRPLA